MQQQILTKKGTTNFTSPSLNSLSVLTLPVPIPEEEKKLAEVFVFTLLCGTSKGFMNTQKALIKPFEAPQRHVKIKISAHFYFNKTF